MQPYRAHPKRSQSHIVYRNISNILSFKSKREKETRPEINYECALFAISLMLKDMTFTRAHARTHAHTHRLTHTSTHTHTQAVAHPVAAQGITHTALHIHILNLLIDFN